MFKDIKQEGVYQTYMKQIYPLRRGGNTDCAFNEGYEGRKCKYDRKWLIYAAYAAGRDKRKQDEKGSKNEPFLVEVTNIETRETFDIVCMAKSKSDAEMKTKKRYPYKIVNGYSVYVKRNNPLIIIK